VAYAAKGQPADGRKEAELFTAASKLVAPEAMFGHSKASDMLGVAENLMLGEILYREGKLDEGLDHLRKAVAIEDTLKYDEPPDWIQPVRHALGAALVREGRYAEAEAVYREDLTRLPNNGWSLFGLSRCLEAQGKGDEAKRIRAQFNEVWNEADVTLSSSCFCLSEK
jgi:tetratricopeptide (TPR) repeat protein